MNDLDIQNNINQDSIDLYKKYLTSCSIKSKETMNTTYKVYLSNMKLFMCFLRDRHDNFYLLDPFILKNFYNVWEEFVAICMKNGNNNRTINNKKTAISTFYSWCEKRDFIQSNPFRKVESLKVTQSDKRRKSYFLSQKEIWEINYEMKKSKNFDLQDRLIFNLILDSACRISALHSLTLEQLDLSNMCFNDVREKEGYIVQIIFFQETKEIIDEILKERKEEGIVNKYLLITKYYNTYNQMSKETIRARVRKIGKIVGIEKLYPHSIRKTIINIISRTGNISDGASLGNHKDTKVTTEHYIEQKKQSDTRNRLEDLRKQAGI